MLLQEDHGGTSLLNDRQIFTYSDIRQTKKIGNHMFSLNESLKK